MIRRRTINDARRDEWWTRAEYYCWAAIRGHAPRDPLTGLAYPIHDGLGRRLGRAVYIAAAREALAIARAFGPLPLP